MNDSEVKKLYSALLKKGYTPEDIGSEDVFTSKMSDEKNRKDLYNYVQGKGNFRLGSYENYERRLTALPANDNAATASQPTGQAAVAVPASAAVSSPSVDDKVEPVTAAMPASEGDSQEYAVGFGAGVKEGGKALWGGLKSAAGETSKLAIGSKDDYARAVERIYEMNDVGYDMSDFNAERAVRDHKMRQYEHDMEEYKKEIAKRKAERKGMGFFESIGHKMSDPQRPRDPFDRSASSTAKMYSPEGMTSEIELQRSYKLVEEALRENGGDIDEAKKWLIKQAKTDTWGDKTTKDAQKLLSEVKPTKGKAAWVGNMIPQMTGNMLAIGASLSPWTRWMSRPLGMANMAALTASSAGSSMAEARMYGEETGTDVSTGDVWAAGGTSALIEAGTEAIPFNRMFGGVQHATKKALGKAIGDVLTNNSAARTELVQLVERAQKELGKDLFSGKNAKEWIVDMGYEGMSEFLAEGGGALVPMIYANEEDYPTLSEVLKSGWEGAKGGIFMGAFLGGANRAVGHYHNRNRRKEQGYVDLAETKDGKVVEVLGKETKEFDDGTEEMTYSVMMPDGSLEHVSPTDIVDSKRISFEEFEHGVTAKMEADVADAYEEGRALMDEESDEGLIDARNGYELAKENLARNVGCEVEELEDALLGGGVYGSLEERLRNFNPENWGEEHTGLFVDYMNARARYNGMIERVQDDIDGKVATALQHIDDNRGADGNITPAVLVDEEQDVYVVNRSGENVVVRDGNGQLRMVSADQVRLTGEPMSAETAKAEAEERIREEESAAAAARIDGTVQLVPGNVYPIATEEGESTVTIVQDNGDGTAVVMLGGDEKQQLSLSMHAIQDMVDAHHRMRLEAAAEADLVGGTAPTAELQMTDDGRQTTDNGQQTEGNGHGAVQEGAPASALERIPVNEQGEQDFEKAPVADSWAALLELNEGDAVEAKDTAEQMVQEAQKALEKEQKKKAAGGSTIMEIQKAKAAHKAMLRGLQSRVEYWTRVANYEEDMRKAEAEAKRRQRKMEQAERGRQLASAGRYTEEYRALGPSQSFREYVLRAISSGGVKFIWSNNDNGTKGLGAHLGLNTPSERGKRLWLQSNSEGMYPELAAQSLLEGYAAEQGMMGYADEETGMTTMDALNEVLDVLGSYDSPSAMFEEVQRMRSEQEEYDADEYAEQEALYQLEQEAEANRMSADEWMTYNEMLAEHIKDVFDSVTDEEIISIFANEYEERDYYERSRIDDALEQGVSEGQGSVEGDGGGRRMVQEDGRADGGDIEGRGEPSPHGVDDGGQQGIGELSSPPVSGEQRVGRKELAAVTMSKKKIPALTDANRIETTQISDLSRNSDSKGNDISGNNNALGEKVASADGALVGGTAPTAELQTTAATASQPTEIGENYWGKIFQWAKGRAIEAANFLKKAKSGYLKGVFYRKEIGNIDLFWGDTKGGLAHIIDKHVIKHSDFSSVEEAVSAIDDIISTGEIHEQPNGRIAFIKGGKRVVTDRTLEGNWVVTAYDETRTQKEKKRSEEDATRLHQDIFGKENGELVSPNSASESKGNDISGNNNGLGEKVASAEGEVNINPTEGQKEAGNYKKGHVRVGAFNITIEQPKGSVRSGVDANGKKWETTMQNTYGYIRGTEGVDGDHIDVFLSDEIDGWDGSKVFVVDQYNEDGSFDEHKVMLGFNTTTDAYGAYLSNYDANWENTHRIVVCAVSMDDFEKWVDSSHRKTKPFAEYKRMPIQQQADNAALVGGTAPTAEPQTTAGLQTTAATPSQRRGQKSLFDVAAEIAEKVDVEGVFADLSEKGEAKLSDHVEQPANVSGNKLVTDERYAELRERMRNKLNGRMNMSVDPEILAIGTEMAVYHIEKGARRFAEFAKAMIADLGDAIRPYLKSFYNGARELPEMESAGLTDAMTPYDEVRTFDVANFDRASTDMAAAAEEEVAGLRKQLEEKAAENTKSKGKDVSLSENEDVEDAEAINGTLETKYYGQEDSDVLVGDNSEGRAGRLGGLKAGNAGVRQEGRESTSNDNKRNRGDSESSKTSAPEGTVATSSDNRRVVDESAIEETPIKELRNRIRNLQALIIGIDNTERIRGIDEEIANKRERYKAELTYAKDVLAKKEGNKWGVEDMQPVSLETAEAMFNEWNDDADVKALFDRVFDVFKKFGIDIKFDDAYKHDNKKAFFDAADNHIVLPMHMTYEEYVPQQEKATILLHEMIHGVTQYVLHAVEMTPESRREKGINISKGMLEAANQLHSIYNYISVGGVYKDVNGMQDVHEMVSQLADPNFRAFLKEQSLWDKIVEAIQKLLGIPVENNALDTSAKLLDYILDNYNIEAYNKLAGRIGKVYNSQGTESNRDVETASQPRIQFEEERIDQEYLDAVHNGNWEKATELFREYVLSKAENEGIVPMDYGVGYRGGAHSSIAKRIKEGNPDAITEAAYQMSIRIPRGSILVPMPSHNGDATYTVKLAETIAMATDSEVMDVLKGKARMSVYEAKQKGIQLSSDELGMYVTEELPKGRNVVIIDNVIDKGTTALAAVSAVKGASVVAYAYTLGDKSRVAPLKLAEPVTYDDNMRIIPLSERYNREREDIRYREKRALKTVSVQDEHLQTVVSSADGAKVLKDLDIAITEYENNTQTKEKTFLGALAKVLGAKKHGSNSQYATFETVNGNVVTIRLSNHNAKASTFDLHDEAEGISIVVTAQENKGITNDGEAHVVEFFYDAIKLRKADGKPLVEILKSIKQALYSGEYQDTTGLAERQEVNERLRSGNGAISDHDVSFQNDPISKFLGKSRHSKKQQAAFAERERKRMKQAVKEVAKKLGVTVDIVEDAALLQGRKAHAKGWFDVNNGKIVVVIPNHVSAWDAVQTVLHEGIAHHGLRKMFGKHFDTFIENVYANADTEVREKIHDLARLNGLDLAKATEEYLASLAEETNFEQAQNTGWWDKIKQFFVEMLTKAGVKLDIKLTDNELRYILWRSYKNLVEPGSVRTFAGVAEDVVMQSRLAVGNYTAATASQHRVQLAADAALVGGVAPTAEQQATDNGRQTTAATPSQHRGQTRAERERERIHRTGRVDTSFMIPRVAESDLVNERFNEQLEGLNEENGRSVILSLGYPSDALLASGVENMPIRLYGSKLLSKAKKHGYKTTDIKGLPMALQHPIAVFEGSTAGSHAILTELSINGKNVLVSLSVGKGGHDVDFNIISSIYGKNEDSVLRWINDGKMRFVDKGKALDYLSVSAPIAEAQDNQELSDAAKVVKTFENPTAREDILFRMGGAPMGDGTREEYDRRVRTSKLLKDGRKSKFALTRYNAMEAFVNELYSLEIAQDIIEKKYGIKLGSTYDAVKAENALSSTNLREYERFRKGMYEDMVSITDGWMQSGEEDGDSVRRYLICKSGLERNREFTVRDAINERIDGEKLPMLGMVTSWSEREALERKFAEKRDALRQAYAQERDALRQRLKDGDIGYAEFNRLSDEVALRHSGKEKIMDYSGLTSVTGDSENFRDMAESLVLDFEARHGDAPQLWNAMNRCTKATLQKSYDSGLMSKREFDHISQMFEWYIPMRGFSERTAEDVYSYINEDTGAFSATVKAAKGHLTESDDPLALIGNMMQSAILQGNRNKMKLKFLNMVQTYPSDLFVVDKVWLVEQADGSWKSEYPEIREDMSADEIAASLVAFEEKMDGLRTAKKARRYRGGLDVDFIIEEPIHKMQHAVSVMRSGERVMVYVNGNPRVAQALNGELKDKNQSIALELWDKYLRWYSASKTSYDVNFVLANLTRDTEHATMMTLMSEGAGESGRFMLNIVPSFLATLRGIRNEVKPTVAARRKKKDEKSERYDRYFGEFLRYGGETGYSHLLSVDDWKSMNDRRMTRLRGLAKGRAHAGRVLEYISDAFDYLNRIAEDTTRFNVYSRCRERGMDIGSSILAAKEITTNFNRKGSGRTPGLWGVLANIVRRWIPFANPIIQGMYRFFRVGAEHKAAFAAVCASHVALGIAIPLLNEFLHAVAGGDDDDEYMNQNDYTRRNNLMLFLGGGYLKVPLAPMFRELYGLGDIFYCSMRGYLSASDAALESVGQIRSMLSIEGQSGDEFSLIRLLTPDQFDWLNDIEQNVTFTGAPIYKDTPYQEWTPEHEKVYKDVWSPLVDVSRLVNRAMGGSDDVAAERSSKWINPAVWQYALSEIGGGPLKFVGDLTGMATDLVKGDFIENFSWYNVPVAKRFWTSPDDRTLDASLNRRYYDVMENEHDRSEHLLRTYKRKATDSVAGYAEKLDTFMKSPTYKRYEKIHGTKSTVNKLRDELKESGSNSVPMLEDTIRKLKIEMLDELETMEK